jgi:4-hydroxy-3-methylbut-2-enyl diphosphate reductase
LINDIEDIRIQWLSNVHAVGLTAGASAPEDLVQRVVHYLGGLGYPEVSIAGVIEENVKFSLPAELARAERNLAAATSKSKEKLR